MGRHQFTYVDLTPEGEAGGRLSPGFVAWLNRQFNRVKQGLPGPQARAIDVGATVTLDLGNLDLAQLRLTDNTVITLKPTPFVRTGALAYLELAQDGTGNWAPTWVNATGNSGSVTAPAIGANKHSLYLVLYTGSTWVLSALAADY